jgi:hypothetical protein
MLFDIKRIEVHSAKEFLKEYFMIVVGILTALMLEHLAVGIHDKELAEQSRNRIVNELQGNLVYVREQIAMSDTSLQRLDTLVASLKDDLHKGASKAEVIKHIKSQLLEQGLNMNLIVPSFHHEAWDLVVADQSLTHVDAASLNRFAAAYELQRDTSTVGLMIYTSTTTSTVFGHLTGDIIDLEFDRVDPFELLKDMDTTRIAMSSMHKRLLVLETELAKALPAEGKGNKAG